jgi:c-di-GMP-binding flagellar brake protein YcgR
MTDIDHDRFRVEDGTEILALLRQSAEARATCTIRASGRSESYLSPLRELDADGAIRVDMPRAPFIGHALRQGSHAAIEARLPDFRIAFDARIAEAGPSGHHAALRLERPDTLLRIERRASVRVRVPVDADLRLTLDPMRPSLRDLQLSDLSRLGAAVTARAVPDRIEPGRLFESARLRLPGGAEWPMIARVAHTACLRRLGNAADLLIGLQFIPSVEGFETAVARVVGQIARGGSGAAEKG